MSTAGGQDHIARDFQATAPNEKWLADVTEFPVPDGKAYLSPMVDCFDGLLVSWSMPCWKRRSEPLPPVKDQSSTPIVGAITGGPAGSNVLRPLI